MLRRNVAAASSDSPIPEPAMTYDEASMQQREEFLKALQELKNLKPQLYSAAEYCESSYIYSNQKQAVLENLRDYSVKTLVNAVDHLGTVAYKLNDLLGQHTSEVAATEMRMASLSQRLYACREYTDLEGLKQQTLSQQFSRQHKHYTFPDDKHHYSEDGLNVEEYRSPGNSIGEVGKRGTSHALPGTSKSAPADGSMTEAEILSDAESNKLSAKQQKFQADFGQYEAAGTLSWLLAEAAQTDSHPQSTQKLQQLESNGCHPFSSVASGSEVSGKAFAASIGAPSSVVPPAKSKINSTKAEVQHSKSVIDGNHSSSVMSPRGAKSNQLRQPQSHNKGVLFSLLGKKLGGRYLKVLNSKSDAL